MTALEINQLAQRVLDQDRFDLAVDFLRSPETQKQNAVWFTYKLMQRCRADQGSFISYLANEFVPEETPSGTVWLLRRYEFKMYRRLKSRHGVDQCLRRYLPLSPEGRALIRWLGKDGNLFDP